MRPQHRARLRIVSVPISPHAVQASGSRVHRLAPAIAFAYRAQCAVPNSSPTAPRQRTVTQSAAALRRVPRAAIKRARLARERTVFASRARQAGRRRPRVSRSPACSAPRVNTSANSARRRVSHAALANFRAVLGKRAVLVVVEADTRSPPARCAARTASQGSTRARWVKRRALLAGWCEAERVPLVRTWPVAALPELAIAAVAAVANTEERTRRRATPARNAHLASMRRARVLLDASLVLRARTKT